MNFREDAIVEIYDQLASEKTLAFLEKNAVIEEKNAVINFRNLT